jgi:hypothetical protein
LKKPPSLHHNDLHNSIVIKDGHKEREEENDRKNFEGKDGKLMRDSISTEVSCHQITEKKRRSFIRERKENSDLVSDAREDVFSERRSQHKECQGILEENSPKDLIPIDLPSMFGHQVTKEDESNDSCTRNQSVSIVRGDHERINEDRRHDGRPDEFGEMFVQKRVLVNHSQTWTDNFVIEGLDKESLPKPVIGCKDVSDDR